MKHCVIYIYKYIYINVYINIYKLSIMRYLNIIYSSKETKLKSASNKTKTLQHVNIQWEK